MSKKEPLTYALLREQLPKEPEERFWAPKDGDVILCKDQEAANAIADFIEALGITDCAVTGYYDPEEDSIADMIDSHTGWYYVDC